MTKTIRCRDKEFSGIEAIIFDKDGTLENSREKLRIIAQTRSRLIDAKIPGVGDPLLMAFGVQGDRLDPTGLTAVGSHYENEIAAAAYIAETGRSWLEARAIAQAAFDEVSQQSGASVASSQMFAGVSECLQRFAEAGLKLGILSADSTENVIAFASQHHIDRYLGVKMGVDGTSPSKPDPELLRRACATLGVKPSATLMVGDATTDIEMARRAEAAGAIGIDWGRPNAPHLAAADVAIAHLDEIQFS